VDAALLTDARAGRGVFRIVERLLLPRFELLVAIETPTALKPESSRCKSNPGTTYITPRADARGPQIGKILDLPA
jgi:hypothetical protein